MRIIVGAAVAVAALMLAGAAAATPLQLTIQPTTFPDSSALSGSFIYDGSTNAFSQINVVTGHNTYTLAVPASSNSSNAIFVPSGTTSYVAGVTPAIFVPSGGNNFAVQSTHVVNVTEGTCTDTNCGGVNNTRQTTASIVGAPPVVPTLGEWAMVMLTAALAGVGALMQRRVKPAPARI